jgi:hypothetical protein
MMKAKAAKCSSGNGFLGEMGFFTDRGSAHLSPCLHQRRMLWGIPNQRDSLGSMKLHLPYVKPFLSHSTFEARNLTMPKSWTKFPIANQIFITAYCMLIEVSGQALLAFRRHCWLGYVAFLARLLVEYYKQHCRGEGVTIIF